MSVLTNTLSRTRDWSAGFLRENIAFIHLPKCGGTSLRQAIESRYPRSRVTRLSSPHSKHAADFLQMDLLALRRTLLVYELHRGGSRRFVTGHYPASPEICEKWRGRWNFVTVLRDPVERWISHYFYAYQADSPFAINQPLDEFVGGGLAQRMGNLYVRHLTGGGSGQDSTEIARASATLEMMSIVGVLESLDRFQEQFTERFGKTLRVGNANRNPTSRDAQRARVTPELRKKIEQLCEPDRVVYEHAMKLSRKR